MEKKQLSTARNLLYLITLFTLLILPAAATTATDVNFLRCLILLESFPTQNNSSLLPPKLHFPTLNRNPSLEVNGFTGTNYYVSETSLFPTASLPLLAIHSSFNLYSQQEVSLLDPLRKNTDPFTAVAYVMKYSGCSFMATFLDAQLSEEYRNGTNFTIFAPLDVVFANAVMRNISNYSPIFRRHVVPRLLTWRDLTNLPDNTLLPTLFSNGFSIRVRVTTLKTVRFVNGVMVVVPEMVLSDFIAVHGIDGLLDNSIM